MCGNKLAIQGQARDMKMGVHGIMQGQAWGRGYKATCLQHRVKLAPVQYCQAKAKDKNKNKIKINAVRREGVGRFTGLPLEGGVMRRSRLARWCQVCNNETSVHVGGCCAGEKRGLHPAELGLYGYVLEAQSKIAPT